MMDAIEYKDDYEEIFAIHSCFGIGIGRIKSDSKEALAPRRLLYKVKGKTKIRAGADDYQIRVDINESFGEDAFRISFKRIESP